MSAITESGVNNPWWKKALWLLLIWSASVLALVGVAYLLRQIMRAAGLAA